MRIINLMIVFIIILFGVKISHAQKPSSVGTDMCHFQNHPWLWDMWKQKKLYPNYINTDSLGGIAIECFGVIHKRDMGICDYTIGHYKNHKKSGNWKFFVGNRIVSECNFENGVMNGIFISYNQNESVQAILHLKDGTILGQVNLFDNGVLVAILNFRETNPIQYDIFYQKTDFLKNFNFNILFEEIKQWKDGTR